MQYDTRTIPLFPVEFVSIPIEERIDAAIKAILTLFMRDVIICVAFSGGKDSSVVANLVLTAAAIAVQKGKEPSIIVSSSNTRIENPEVVEHVRQELARMGGFARAKGIRFQAEIVQPNLTSTFQVKILTGRGIPSFPGTSADCSIDLKVRSQINFRRKLFAAVAARDMPEVVTCLGTRYDESERRAATMAIRGENAILPVRNKNNELILAVIADWDTDSVWEYLGMCTSGLIESYSDFKDTLRIYAHSAGTSCAVVADSINEGKPKKGGCGTRLGCHQCQMATDKSLENMIEFDPKYEYARGLNKLNKFIRATRYDWSLRHWVGRTIKGGYIAIQPDTYHPDMIRRLSAYMLQLDFDEMVRSRQRDERQKFEMLPLDMMVAIDALQSLNGVARPFSMWRLYDDIRNRRVRYDIPTVTEVPEVPLPDARFLYVGEEWDTTSPRGEFSGMRDVYFEGLTEGAGCSPPLRTLRNGKAVWDVNSDDMFSVDIESIGMIEDFEKERLLQYHASCTSPSSVTFAYKWYLQYGCLNLSHGHIAKHDEILRRTAFKDREGLTLSYDIDRLIHKSIPFSQLPAKAAQAWARKATTDSAQAELRLAA